MIPLILKSQKSDKVVNSGMFDSLGFTTLYIYILFMIDYAGISENRVSPDFPHLDGRVGRLAFSVGVPLQSQFYH